MKNPKTTASVSRRNFIQTGAAATSFMVLPNWVIGQSASPNGKLNVAVIGAGGRGKAHVSGLQGENFVGFCDVDDKTAADTYKKFPKVARFKDYRKMFDKLQGKIDAVSIATPDHMHYPIALWALSQGINVYCEKPLARVKGGPFAEFVGAIKAGKQAGSAFSYAADFVENALLGLVAAEAGQPIEYDGANMKITNIPEANKFLRSQYEYKKEFLPA